MSYQDIIYEKSGKVARVILNRPERLNAISATLPDELERAVAEANADPEEIGRASCRERGEIAGVAVSLKKKQETKKKNEK